MGNCNFKTEKENSELCKYTNTIRVHQVFIIFIRNNKGSLQFLVSNRKRWLRKSMEGRE